MQLIGKLLSQPKSRKAAIAIALLATVVPLPLAGLHKFYLGQPLWGAIYLLLWNTPVPRIAAAIDAVWYFVQGEETFHRQFNGALVAGGVTVAIPPPPVAAIAEGLRELERLRTEGLVSEYEFEQKRRQLLERIS
jgi:TM2 domain-containing membrane protein YozV